MSGLSPSLLIAGLASLLLVLVFLAASAIAGWYDERARRVLVAVRHGAALRAGFGAFRGEARPLDGRPGGLLVTTTRTEVRFGGGAWRDVGRETTGTPFALVLESGEEIEVDPRDAVLKGWGADSPSTMGVTRETVTRLCTGDVIWATGVLMRKRDRSEGAYRSTVARRRLVAPRRGRIALGPESPLPGWQALARAHKLGGYLAAGALFGLHVSLFRAADLALVTHDCVTLRGAASSGHQADRMIVGALLALAVTAFGWRQLVVRTRLG
jgi:hypothetical protein